MKITAPQILAFLFGLFVVPHIVAGCSGEAHASDAGTCYTIRDSDARTYCLARAHNQPAQCYSIQRADMRAQCLAEVRK